MRSKTTALIGLCLLLLLGCQGLNRSDVPDDWSMVRIPVGLNAWLPCIPVEQPPDAKLPGDRSFECPAGPVLIRAWYYGGGQSYNLEKGAAGFERDIRSAVKRKGAQIVHHQSRTTVIYPSRLASGMEPQLTKLFQTLEVRSPRTRSTTPSP